MTCTCEPDLDDGRFSRSCDYCGTASASAGCAHAPHQEPCPECSVLPATQLG